MAGLIRFPTSAKIKGESKVEGFSGADGWIQLNSISQSITRAIQEGRSGSARQRAGVVMPDITIEKELDLSTPPLVKAVCAGSVFDTVELVLGTMSSTSTKGKLNEYWRIILKSCMVTSFEFSGSGTDDGEIPTETWNLNFDEIEWIYSEYDKDNNFVAKHTAGWLKEQQMAK